MPLTATPPAAALIPAEMKDLGDDPDQVADLLYVTGSLGRRDAAANPVVLYLCRRVRLDGPLRVRPGGGVLEMRAADGETLIVPLPPAVREFLARFDAGHYPELEGRCAGREISSPGAAARLKALAPSARATAEASQRG
jgi:hypothetical protein